jgi:mannan endo-1,6-alpha-mannosidase
MKPSTLFFATAASAIDIQFDQSASVKTGLKTIADGMLSYYTGDEPGGVPGLLPGSLACNPANEGTYCWWEAGAMWGSLINYWQYTGDSSYNAMISEAMLFQRGPDDNFNPPNQSRSMGIDDQDFWAFTAMDAVEANFPESENEGDPSWLSLAQGTFNFQSTYWDTATCGGGFRWQVFLTNAGYNLKNMISNGGNFQLAARLAYVTGNQSYADWAEMVWDWMEESPMFERTSDGLLYIWDNTNADNNCTDVTNYIWSYNYGTLIAGAAYMYNTTDGNATWKARLDELLDSTYKLYFPADKGGNIMVEYLCEEKLLCNQDQKSFKAYLSRWLAVTAMLYPESYAQIHPKLVASAQGAAGQCDGASNGGNECGMQWYSSTFDGQSGVGEEVWYPALFPCVTNISIDGSNVRHRQHVD